MKASIMAAKKSVSKASVKWHQRRRNPWRREENEKRRKRNGGEISAKMKKINGGISVSEKSNGERNRAS